MLDVLRDELGLTGTKEGCGTGDCGACSVLVDDRLVCACLMLGVEASGKNIETIEGIAGDEGLHPLQRQFLENAALQCGICTQALSSRRKHCWRNIQTRMRRRYATGWRETSAGVRGTIKSFVQCRMPRQRCLILPRINLIPS